MIAPKLREVRITLINGLTGDPSSGVDTERDGVRILALVILRSHLDLSLPYWRRVTRLALFLITAALILGASPVSAQSSEPLQVVVSLQPYQDLVERVAGERAEVSTLLPPGASPHSFDPTPSQAAALARADLVIMNGGLDLWLARLVAATSPGTPVLTLLDSIEFDPVEGHDHDHDEHDEAHNHDDADSTEAHDHTSTEFQAINSHVWLDPTLMIPALDAVAAALTEADPAGAETYAANALRTQAELRLLDEKLTELMAPAAGAPFVPFHDAWVYFAQRYDLNTVVTLEPFPGREPSPRYVAEAVRDVIASGAKVIFAERQLGSRSAEVVAQSAGVEVAILDPLGGAPGPTSYEALLLENAAIIVAALTE